MPKGKPIHPISNKIKKIKNAHKVIKSINKHRKKYWKVFDKVCDLAADRINSKL